MKALFLFALLAIISNVHPQSISSTGAKISRQSLNFLKGEKELEIHFDYSHAKIKHLSEEDFLQLKAEERGEEWVKYWNNEVKKTLKIKFLNQFNEVGAIYAGYKENSKMNYIATIYVLNVNDNGETEYEVTFRKRGSEEILARIPLKGKGGHFGTLENLMGDSYKRAGQNLAKIIQKQMR